METSMHLADRIVDRLERHRRELEQRQGKVDDSMKKLLEERERFAVIARRIEATVIVPRMEELPRHFSHATIGTSHVNGAFSTYCTFAHTLRFPATVTVAIALVPGNRPTEVTARYDLDIKPELMEYRRSSEAHFPADAPDETIGAWVVEMILDFVDTYLRLETHPYYQKENTVTDPVCGMQISAIAAPSSIEMPDRTIYFCSELCKETFLKQNASI